MTKLVFGSLPLANYTSKLNVFIIILVKVFIRQCNKIKSCLFVQAVSGNHTNFISGVSILTNVFLARTKRYNLMSVFVALKMLPLVANVTLV